ncbi:MAG: type III-B CRISPR module RAMP protein Cmr4, partial [Candidatus Electrothrix sp. ATG2]|nr:type III-B CRISPR module RAMP protein Cmr4 [Candidatus Electrothrix sp. ATG2]
PYALKKYQQFCEMLNINGTDFVPPSVLDSKEDSQAIAHENTTEEFVFLEEYRFKITKNKEDEQLERLIKALATLMQQSGVAENVENDLKKQLIIVSDDDFSYLVNHATPVNAHIALDSATKTVMNGALWYEETLPPETLLYTGLSANDARDGKGTTKANDILGAVLDLFKEKHWVQLGGNETVGMGWCAVSPIKSAKKG